MFPLFRAIIGLLALAILFQATSMGIYLAGYDSFLALHRTGAMMVGVLALAQLVVAILYVVRDKGDRMPLRFSIGMFVVVLIQMALGFAHNTAFHVPLGVLMFGGMIRMLLWAGPEYRLRQAVARQAESARQAQGEPGVPA